MGHLGFARSIAVVLAGVLLIAFIDQTLERTLVMAMANAPVQDEQAYLAIRNQLSVLGIMIVTHALAALLTGYVLAKLAGSYEVQHAGVTATFVVLLLLGASASPNVLVPPTWVRLTMAVVTPPAMIAGAYIRGQARMIREERG
jgi:hypothetical protein